MFISLSMCVILIYLLYICIYPCIWFPNMDWDFATISYPCGWYDYDTCIVRGSRDGYGIWSGPCKLCYGKWVICEYYVMHIDLSIRRKDLDISLHSHVINHFTLDHVCVVWHWECQSTKNAGYIKFESVSCIDILDSCRCICISIIWELMWIWVLIIRRHATYAEIFE